MLELLIETEDEWNVAGRCNDNNGTLTHLFFSDNISHQARAKAAKVTNKELQPNQNRKQTKNKCFPTGNKCNKI